MNYIYDLDNSCNNCEKSSKMYNFSPENVQAIPRHKVYKSMRDGFPV